MTIIRRVGAVVLLAAGVAVWFGLAPQEVETPDNESSRDSINETDDGNNILTDGAPQQSVVNGWTTIDYLELLSEQLDEAAAHDEDMADQRPAALLGLCLAGICLIAATPSAGGVTPGPGGGQRVAGAGPTGPPPDRRPVAGPEAEATLTL